MEPSTEQNPPTILTETLPETPETPTNPPVPVTPELPADLLKAYNDMLAESRRDAQAARAELERVQAERNAPPPKTPEQETAEYFENPLQALRNEINKAVAPINEAVKRFSSGDRLAQLKNEMRQDSRFDKLSQIETEFDALLTGADLNAPSIYNIMIGAYYNALGVAFANGKLNTPAETPNPTPAPKPVTTPPHLRPTPPAPPQNTNTKTLRDLTENEETIRRYNKQTKEEFLIELEGGALKL